MISIYLDWNVIIQMKNNFHPGLKTILDSKRFFIPYSASHIGDMLSGFNNVPEQQGLIDQDLKILSELTENNYLSNDGKEIKLIYSEPRELFDDRLSEKDLFQNFSLDKIEEMFEEEETIKALVKQSLDSIRNIPLDKVFVDALTNPESAKYLDTMFPDLKDNPTMEGFFKSFGEMMTRINENDDYKELRKITQGGLGINRDKIFNSEDPYSMIEKTYQKLNFNGQQYVQQDKQGPSWFNDISNEYIKLDMHGYQEDRVSTTKGRKETFRNTMEDAFHAGFASTCNFYILNDNRAYHKTKKVYEKIGMNTLVFKPDEFLNYYNTFLSERAVDLELKIPVAYLSAESFAEEKIEDGHRRTYHLPYFVFDFFNKVIATFDDSGKTTMLTLSSFAPTNKIGTYHFEIENLSSKLYGVFGDDTEKLGHIKQVEFGPGEWGGRKWNFGDIAFRLLCPNGEFQLFYDLADIVEQ
jgi:hypothetical protein